MVADWSKDDSDSKLMDQKLSNDFSNPAAAHHDVAVVEDHSLARGDGPLRFVESYANFAITGILNHSRSGLVPVTNLGANPHRFFQCVDADPVHLVRYQSARQQVFVAAYGHSSLLAVDLDYIERRAGCNAESFALAYSEFMNAVVMAENSALSRDNIS